MGAGRPKKYKTRKAFSDAIDKYFKSISRTVTAKELTGREILNDDGEKILMTQYIRPPSISGLCLYLHIDRSTWANYCDADLHPETAPVAAEVRATIEAYLEEQLVTREKSVQGIIFNLQNNYGWKDRKELEIGDKTRKTMAAAAIPLAERETLLRELAQEFGDSESAGDTGGAGET